MDGRRVFSAFFSYSHLDAKATPRHVEPLAVELENIVSARLVNAGLAVCAMRRICSLAAAGMRRSRAVCARAAPIGGDANNFGNTLQRLGECGSSTARLGEAVAAYDGALSVYENAEHGWDLSGIRRARDLAAAPLARKRG
jgi:hypothetical protein